MLWPMTSDVPLTQCYQGRARQRVAPVHLCQWKKGGAPAAAAGLADTQDAGQVTAHIRKLWF